MGWEYLGVSSQAAVASGNVVVDLPLKAIHPGVLGTGVCYSSDVGLFVATGATGAVHTSPDGITWTSRAASSVMFAVIYAAGKFVAVGSGSTIITSSDGVTWTTQNTGTGDFACITYSALDSLFVAAGASGQLYTSPDGVTWTSRATGTTEFIAAVAHSESLGLFVACGVNGLLLSSPDGITWTIGTSGTSNNLSGACFSETLGLFVVAGQSGTLLTSTNGITWTSRVSGLSTYIEGVEYFPDKGLFVAVGEGSAISTSPDGTTWTVRSPGYGEVYLEDVEYAPPLDLFLAIGDLGYFASKDGVTWYPGQLKSGDLLVAAIAYRSTNPFSLPAGWGLVATQQSSGNTSTTASSAIGSGLMAYTTFNPALARTFTRTGGDVALPRVVSYRGHDQTAPYDTGSANTLAANSTTVTTASVTTSADGALIVLAGCGARNAMPSNFIAAIDPNIGSGTNSFATTNPLNGSWLGRAYGVTTTGADTAVGFADAVRETAGSTGTLQYTSTVSSRHVAIAGVFKLATGPTADPRYARPTSDIAQGDWTPSSGSDLYAMLDETAYSDADYTSTTSASACTLALGAVTDPGTSSGQVLRYRAKSDAGSTLVVTLKQGATTIATRTHTAVPSSYTEYVMTLTGGECDAITDYSALRVTLEAQ